jgi:hypothetical protein
MWNNIIEKAREAFHHSGMKNTFWNKLRVFNATNNWINSNDPNKKSWFEFKNGMVKHTHVFNEDSEIDYSYGCKLYKCIHVGCFVYDDLDIDK